jgi:hypothetical protein
MVDMWLNDERWDEREARAIFYFSENSRTHEVMVFPDRTGLSRISYSHRGTRYDQRAGSDSPACLVRRV